MTRNADPERELVRRALPFGPPAVALALLLGIPAGWPVAWSAALGVAVVVTNFVVHGLSLSRAARISLVALGAVAVGGFVIRLGAIVALLFLLDRFSWFSPLGFGLAVIPATILLLAFEMRLMARGVGMELRLSEKQGTAPVNGGLIR